MNRNKLICLSLMAVVLCLGLSGCRSTYYAAWEKFGKHKRDLLKDNVEKARDEQQQAKTEFKDALTRLRELTKFDGGALEKAYKQVESDYNDCKDRSESIRSRITEMQTVANDLFREWEQELQSYSSPSLRATSREKLQQTRRRYQDLETALTRSANAMDPVLAKLKDQTLFLKHNLNAEAVGSLKGEVISIEADVRKLIEEMNTAIERADEFIKGMPTQ